MIPLPKVQPLLPRREWKTGRSSFPDKELSGYGKPPGHRLLNCFYIPQLIYAIIIAGVNIPSDSR